VKKILLDECIPRKFKNCLPGHECVTVPEAGWAGKKNGELLFPAERARFDVFVTLDQGLGYEQNLSGRDVAILLLRAKSNRLADLARCAAGALAALESVRRGQLVKIAGVD